MHKKIEINQKQKKISFYMQADVYVGYDADGDDFISESMRSELKLIGDVSENLGVKEAGKRFYLEELELERER